jgi:hypothetical protein
MTLHRFLACTLALTASVAAQNYVTSPKGFLATEGNSTATTSLGDYQDGRFQYADGTYRGTAMTVKGTAYRLANYNYTSTQGLGRRWYDVRLYVSECDLATFSTTFTKNPTTVPTQVFSSKVEWPTQLLKPTTLPAPWSIQFPFATNWQYSGTGDLCFEYVFVGGTLYNSVTWGTGQRLYYKDAHSYPTSETRASTSLGYSGLNVGCNDRGVTHTYGAEITSTVAVYNGEYSTVSYRDRIHFVQNGQWFPPSKPLTTAVGFGSLRYGVDFPGVHCNKVHIDFTLPTFVIPVSSDSGGKMKIDLWVDNPGLQDLPLVTQTVWADSSTAVPMLSNAAVLEVPTSPPTQPINLLLHNTTSSAVGWLRPQREYHPIIRIAR